MNKAYVTVMFAFVMSVIGIGSAVEVGATPPAAYEGMRLYVSYCQLCHSPSGKGAGPLAKKMGIKPADLTTTVRSRSDTILKKIITGKGRQTITGRDRHNLISRAMPEWEKVFDDTQIDAIIAYLRFLSRSNHTLMGDPEVGYKLYKKYCVVCHGEEGGGDGIMGQLLDIQPTDHSNPNEMREIKNHQLINIIRTGKGDYMPAWKNILTRDEMEALVSYIRLLSN
ncbi:MAG: c-type cytochrome [Magnetococcales bacterium]|nr:c-type cytochrome [Magnetococcales bacterium]